MGVYVDVFYELGMTFRDVNLFCDICEVEDYYTTRAYESRRMAKKDGWLRKFIKQEEMYMDICPKCKEKFK